MEETVETKKKKLLRRRILEHLLGPFGSIVFHVLIVFAAIKFLGMVGAEKEATIQVQIMEPDAIDLEEFEKELEEMQELQEMTDLIAPPDQNIDVTAPPDVSTDVAPAEDISMDLADLNVISDAQSPLVMRGLYEGRSASGRSKMLGGAGRYAKDVENSVNKALEWLKNNQRPDGSWEGNAPAMAGLAILTFLANGETPSSEKYGPTVEKGIKFLVGLQEKNGGGRFSEWTPGGEGGMHDSYSHGIATYALSEAYGLTRIPSLRPVMESAVQLIIDGQQPGGSWDYGYRKTARRDASVAGWQLQALKAASIAGAANAGLKEAIIRGVEELKEHQHAETGRFPYSEPNGGTISITGVSVLCLQLAGYGKDSATKRGIVALREADVDWKKPLEWPMYSWYYITQAKFQNGGMDWNEWNKVFAIEIIRNQNDDGSWTTAGVNLEGDVHGKETSYGPVYSTTLAALTLQVYYRFLPTYKPVEVEEEVSPTDEIVIEII